MSYLKMVISTGVFAIACSDRLCQDAFFVTHPRLEVTSELKRGAQSY